MKMKKYLNLFVAVMMSVVMLSGCGGEKATVVMEDPDKVPEDSYEINWYLPIANQKDKESVEDEINKYLKDKINKLENDASVN